MVRLKTHIIHSVTQYSSSTIVENLEKARRKVLAYWYFDTDDSETLVIENLLCSLLRQLSAGTEKISDAVQKLSDEHRKRGSRPGLDELLSALHSTIPRVGKDVALVLDGLDEFENNSRSAQPSELLKMIKSVAEHGHENLHLLLMSRDQENIRKCLRPLSNPPREVNIERLVLSDLDMYFDNFMESSPALQRLKDDTKDKIRDRLMTSEQRSEHHPCFLQITDADKRYRRFRWTALNLAEIQRCGNDQQARETLKGVPDTVEAKYLQVLENISKNKYDAEFAEIILKWLCVSKRPLTSIELAKAAELSDPSDVMRICTSTLVISSTESVDIRHNTQELVTIRFAHSSVKEYLLSESLRAASENATRFYVSVGKAHADVTMGCLNQLNRQSEIIQPEHDLRVDPLLQYASKYWHVHMNAITRNENYRKSINHSAYELFRSSRFYKWLQIADPEEEKSLDRVKSPAEYPGPLYYALMLGLREVALKLLSDDVDDVNGRCGIEGTALQLAAHRGYTSIVKRLVNKGALINAEGGSHGSALYASTLQGFEEIVDVLLEAGADINRREGEYGSAMQVTSYLPYKAIFHMLVRHQGIDVNIAGGRFGSPLGAASAAGHQDFVRCLLNEKGVDPDSPGGILGSPLQAALMGEHRNVAYHLSDQGARYNKCGRELWLKAYDELREENEHLVSHFEKKLTSHPKIPQELNKNQQLLAAVIIQTPRNVLTGRLSYPRSESAGS